jgi:alpha-galactosidase
VNPLPRKIMLERIYPEWLEMEITLEALKTGDKSMLLYSILESHQTRSYDQAVGVLDALLSMDPSEPMAYIEDINKHYRFPKNW